MGDPGVHERLAEELVAQAKVKRDGALLGGELHALEPLGGGLGLDPRHERRADALHPFVLERR